MSKLQIQCPDVVSQMTYYGFTVSAADLIDQRDCTVAQAHDTVSLLRKDLPCLPSFTAKHNWEASVKQLQLVLYENASTAALLSCKRAEKQFQ